MNLVKIGTALNNECRFYIANAKELIQDIKDKTNYTPTAIAALGRSSMITGIIALMSKDSKKVTSIVNGGGSAGTIIVSAKNNGEIKSRITNPLADALKINNTKLNVRGIIGINGSLKVIKDLNLREPFASEVKLVSGELAEDYTYYFASSEQIPTAIAAGVLIDIDQTIKEAGCFIVQLLPDASEETITKLEEIFLNIKNITSELENKSIDEILIEKFGDNYKVLETKELNFKCDCSKKKFTDSLKLLSPSDILNIKKEKEIEVVCDFCYKKYKIQTKDL